MPPVPWHGQLLDQINVKTYVGTPSFYCEMCPIKLGHAQFQKRDYLPVNTKKELPRLAHSKLQESQETAHTNSYTIVDITSKFFQYEKGWSLLIKLLLKTLARLKVANLITSLSFWSHFSLFAPPKVGTYQLTFAFL